MLGLKHNYISVSRGNARSYGGSQMWSERDAIRKCGCGPVAALDLTLYLRRNASPVPQETYDRELQELCQKYFMLIPPFGINGFSFVLGLNHLLRDLALPYRAIWAASEKKLWPRIEGMLHADLPVILSVGPNFPIFWGKDKLNFYAKAADGTFRKATATKAHYVTATGIDNRWLRISSWGREYYIDREEYDLYTHRHSNYLLSNIVYLKMTK